MQHCILALSVSATMLSVAAHIYFSRRSIKKRFLFTMTGGWEWVFPAPTEYPIKKKHLNP